jgi:hypothetical protein
MAVAALAGLALGLVEDAQGLLAFGANGVSMAVVGALAVGARKVFDEEAPFFAVVYLFLGKWTRDLLHWVAVGSESRSGAVGSLLVDAVVGALYLTAVGLVLTYALGILRRRRGVK